MASKYRYEVRTTTVVDHPERRDASFAPVDAGTYVQDTHRFQTQGAALRTYRDILGGRDDFSSEFIISVQVVRVSNETGSSVCSPGPIVGRERRGDVVCGSYTYKAGTRVSL